jgi:hypothetical protein
MKPPLYASVQFHHLLENKTVDELAELFWCMENSRVAWKRIAEGLLADEHDDSAIDNAIRWDGEIAAWKRR